MGLHHDRYNTEVSSPYKHFNSGVSKWKFSQDAINERNETCQFYPDDCKDEAWFTREFDRQFQDKFGLAKNFSYAFIDSWSQTLPNTEDPTQQQHWIMETDKLWSEATGSDQTFEFKTIDDVLEENARCKQENQRLNDIIDDNITELYSRVNQNELNLTENKAQIDIVNSRVNQNELDLTENKAAISVNADHITDIETESKKKYY